MSRPARFVNLGMMIGVLGMRATLDFAEVDKVPDRAVALRRVRRKAVTTRLRMLCTGPARSRSPGSLRRQEPELVPRRIHVSSNGAQAVDGAPQLAGAADEIYAAVAARIPLVRVDDPRLPSRASRSRSKSKVTATA